MGKQEAMHIKQPSKLVQGRLGIAKDIAGIVSSLAEQEKRQDAVLPLAREVVRDCSIAIRHLHTGDLDACRSLVKGIAEKVKNLQAVAGEEFAHTADTAYQEFVEVSALLAIVERNPIPSYRELGVPPITFLNGLADCSGELRRQIQIALKNNASKDAEYYFACLDELYEELMTIKFSSSLVGALKRKQDVLRGTLESARSEMLRSK